MSTPALPFFIGSSLYLQVTSKAIKSWMGSKFGKIGPGSAELATLYASVTFALRRVYDARTMSKSPFPCGLRRQTLRSSYGFTDIVASTILLNSAK